MTVRSFRYVFFYVIHYVALVVYVYIFGNVAVSIVFWKLPLISGMESTISRWLLPIDEIGFIAFVFVCNAFDPIPNFGVGLRHFFAFRKRPFSNGFCFVKSTW